MSSRTETQEQELKNKRAELTKLENQQTQEPKKSYWPWILGGVGIIGLVGVIVYYLLKKDKSKEYE